MATEFLEFVRTPTYEHAIAGVLSHEAEREFVELPLLEDPQRGVLVAGTGGFRKLRVPLAGRGNAAEDGSSTISWVPGIGFTWWPSLRKT